MKNLLCFFFLCPCLWLFGCHSASNHNAFTTETYVGTPLIEASNVKIRDGVKTFERANGLLSISVEPGRLLYEFKPDANVEINAGDILVGAEQNGFIRRALDVTRTDNSIAVTTERATLLDALESADISIRFGPGVPLEDAEDTTSAGVDNEDSGGIKTTDNNESGDDNDPGDNTNEIELDFGENQSPLKAAGQPLDARQFKLLDEDAQFFRELNRELDYPLLGDVGDGLWLEGRVSTALDFDFTLKIRDGKIVSSESELRGEVQGQLTLKAESTLAVEGSGDISLLSLRPIVLVGAVGFLPFVVTLTPEIGLTFGGRIGTNASVFTARMNAGSVGSAKVVYQTAEDRWQSQYELRPPTFDANVDVQGPRISNSVSASVALVPQVNVQFYESSGARLQVPLSVEATVETDAQDPCANVSLDLTASVLLTPESRWDWITDLLTIDEIELVETSLASATYKPCRGTPSNDTETTSEERTDSMDEREPRAASNPTCGILAAWRIDDAEGEFTVSINGERQSLRLDPSLDFGDILGVYENKHALCAEVFWQNADWNRQGAVTPPFTPVDFEAILVDDAGTPKAVLTNTVSFGFVKNVPGAVLLYLDVATNRNGVSVNSAYFSDAFEPPTQGSVSIEVEQPACGGDYVLVVDNLPLTGGFYFPPGPLTRDLEEPEVTLSGRLRFRLPDVTELSNSEIQPASDCSEAEAAAFDVQSSAPNVLPFTGQCMGGTKSQGFIDASEWLHLLFLAEPIDAVHRHDILRTDLWKLSARFPKKVEVDQVLPLVTVTADGPPTPEDGVAFMSLGYDGDGMSGLDWQATSGEITIDSVELGDGRLSAPKRLSARFEATFERIADCPTGPGTPRGPVTVTGRIEFVDTDQ